ncbi:penicillin-binding transpeptidase domain-containing protein [Methylopila sp. M107]|uniref:penicillin-binding transpeptidase domain-containing protein n=1 Tax=Methylopila sp. M107 TaxID=1101190 RepID=UPI00037B103A|nr:penicillin-binding transpeptidase domain-containing protein [Methylopila sp. M107]
MLAFGGEIGFGAHLSAVGLALAMWTAPARADGPVDLATAFQRAFGGVEACVALRDVAPGAGSAVSDAGVCGKRLPPCATFQLPSTVVALDRGVAGDAGTPFRRNPVIKGDRPEGVTLREAFQQPVPWVYEEIARRLGPEAFARSLATMRYGNAEQDEPVESVGRGGREGGLVVSAPEQVEFLARLKRGELPTSSESQSRTIEIMPVEKIGDVSLASKTGVCDAAGWIVGWVDRPQRSSVVFAVMAVGPGHAADDLKARTRKLLGELALTPAR